MNTSDALAIYPGVLRKNPDRGNGSPEPVHQTFDFSPKRASADGVVSTTLLSVLVCSHNPKPAYLDRVLNALAHQTLGSEKWELLLVDSASDEPLVDRFDLTWHPRARHLREEQPGKTRAFLRGLAVSTGPILVIVDDDNVLAPDYLQQTGRIAEAHPNLGAWGQTHTRAAHRINHPHNT